MGKIILGELSISFQGFWSSLNAFASAPLARLIVPTLTSILLGVWLSVYLPARKTRQEEVKKTYESLAKLKLEIQNNLKVIASIKEDFQFAIGQVERYSAGDKEMNEALKSHSKLQTETFKDYRASLHDLLAGDKSKIEKIEVLYKIIEDIQDFLESDYSSEQDFDHSRINKKRKLKLAKEMLSEMQKALGESDVLLNSFIPS